MGTILDDIYDVLFHPRTALGRIAAERKVAAALIVFLASVFIPMWAINLGLQAAGSTGSLSLIMVFQAFVSLLAWLAGTAVWHLCAELLGGRGSAVSLLTAFGFAHFPRIFIVPLWVLATLLPDPVVPFFMVLTGLAVALWTLYLEVLAISVVHEISRAKAVLVFLTPLLVLIASAVIITFFAGAALIQWPLGLEG